MLELVRFNCRCIGTKPVNGHSILLSMCDVSANDDHPSFEITDRNKHNAYEPLKPAEAGRLIARLATLVADGHTFRRMMDDIHRATDKNRQTAARVYQNHRAHDIADVLKGPADETLPDGQQPGGEGDGQDPGGPGGECGVEDDQPAGSKSA